jgi:hypothetical protein
MPAAVSTRPPATEHELDPVQPVLRPRRRGRSRGTSYAIAGTAAVLATVLGVSYGVSHWGSVAKKVGDDPTTSTRSNGPTGSDSLRPSSGVSVGTSATAGGAAAAAGVTTLPSSSTGSSTGNGAVAPNTPVPSSGAFVGSSHTVGHFAYMQENAGHKPSASEALSLAKTYDVIVALPGQLGSNMPAMRKANPGITLLGYLNGSYAQSSEGSKYPSSWYATTKSGSKIRSAGFGNYLMRPDNSGWQGSRAAECKKIIASGYMGCLLDMVGPAPLMPGYNNGVPAKNGVNFTQAAWLTATGSVGRAVSAANPGHPIWGNGYSSGHLYFAGDGPSSILRPSFSQLLTESWIRGSTTPLVTKPNEAYWRSAVDQLADLESRGLGTAAIVKIWASGSTAAKAKVAEWATASFLLGAGQRSFLAISYARGDDPTSLSTIEKASIGKPAGTRQRASNGIWKRAFTGGLVLVNPTGSTITVPLGRSYVGSDGKKVTSVTMAPNTGRVLKFG